MPFHSRKQWKWAFSMHKKFAKKWARETPTYKGLPNSEHSKARKVVKGDK